MKSIVCLLDDDGAEVHATVDPERLLTERGRHMFPVSVYDVDVDIFKRVSGIPALPRRVSLERAAMLFGRLPIEGEHQALVSRSLSALEPEFRRRVFRSWAAAVEAAAELLGQAAS